MAMDLPDFSKELNESQLQAVIYCDGPLLVIAGAGSGKTRVLTYKIAYLLQQGYQPGSILSLTFTNKAAREMNQRIAQLVKGQNVFQMWSGTFHSIFSKILRRESHAIGYTPDYTIYDTSDSRSLIKTIIKEFELDDKKYKPSFIAYRISEAKNRLILPQTYGSNSNIYRRDQSDQVPRLRDIYELYVKRCQQANAMDFDDLLLNTYQLFKNREDIRKKYADHFKYILVDEYQDTNFAQQQILSLLTIENKHICVVGDDAQSIYAFRGADINNILQFTSQYPNARCVKLECNYRSTHTIVEAANTLISHNVRQITKNVYSNNETGEPIHLMECCSDKEECIRIATEISKLKRRLDVSYNDMALLYRTNAQSRPFEEAFRNARIPYRIYGGVSFYQRKEIKDIIAYLRLICNPNDEEAFKRIINYPARGIGDTTLKKIQIAANQYSTTLWEVIQSPGTYQVDINKATANKLYKFYELIRDFQEACNDTGAYDLTIRVLKETGLAAEFAGGNNPEEISRRENIEELIGAIKEYEEDILEETGNNRIELSDFLSHVSLLTDSDKTDDETPKVTLMTVHAAKGLEFEAVFISGLEDNLFPNENASHNPKEMEEERRLFYVALTRAKKHCYLSYAQRRLKFGCIEYCIPSPFIKEIGAKYVQSTNENDWGYATTRHTQSEPLTSNSFTLFQRKPSAPTPRLRRVTATTTSPSQTPSSASPLKIGNVIEHERFGIGTVVNIEGVGESIKARVQFKHIGEKNLLLKFAKFKIISD